MSTLEQPCNRNLCHLQQTTVTYWTYVNSVETEVQYSRLTCPYFQFSPFILRLPFCVYTSAYCPLSPHSVCLPTVCYPLSFPLSATCLSLYRPQSFSLHLSPSESCHSVSPSYVTPLPYLLFSCLLPSHPICLSFFISLTTVSSALFSLCIYINLSLSL
jgi:hypothetical protein